jgi:glucose-6-phosphate 1-epimerase
MAEDDPCRPLSLGRAPRSRFAFVTHGGQVLEWTPVGSEVSRLWLSPDWRCGPGAAIRGGVPVVFPQFSDRGPLPKHGIARDREWEALSGG